MYYYPIPIVPRAGESREQLMRQLWDRQLSDAVKGQVLADAEARGCQWIDILMEMAVEWDALDPVEQARYRAMDQWEAMPLGQDPWLRKAGDHDA